MDKSSLSGFRDLLAQQLIPRQKMIDAIKMVYERYGFVPLETPAIERYETLAGKYGEEGEKLMYKFEDHGGRKIALRYDLTVPLARVVSQYRGVLRFPYRRYQIGNVWRGESPQAGRYREFMQFDADVVGTSGSLVDAEIVAMMVDTMKALGIEAVVRVNNRCLLDALVEVSGIDPNNSRKLMGMIDKAEKVGTPATLKSVEAEFGASAKKLVKEYLSSKGTTTQKLLALEKILKNSPKFAIGEENIRSVFDILGAGGYSEKDAVFDPTIARGLDYYTGIIFETQLVKLPEIGSVCSGGRYDNLVKDLGGPDMPAVGTSVGVDRLLTALEKLGKLTSARTTTQVFIVSFRLEDNNQYFKVATKLRTVGITVEISSLSGFKTLRDQFGMVDKLGIPFALLMGPDEIAAGNVVIKNTQSREQKTVKLDNLVVELQKLLPHQLHHAV